VPQQVAIEGPPFSSRLSSSDAAGRGGPVWRRRRWPEGRATAFGAGQRVLHHGAERAYVRPTLRGQPALYLLTPGYPSATFLRWCLAQLSTEETTRVLTGALAPDEQAPFLEAGFSVVEHLSLLELDFRQAPRPAARRRPADRDRRRSGWALRRARQSDRPQVLAVDHAAFEPFWRLDDGSLDEALAATPDRRFRVAVRPRTSLGRERTVAGYAVTGLALHQGYIQRLAVDPADQRKGAGRALLADGLRWLERKGAARAVVNTQETNQRALTLYEGFGFQLSPERLSVLGADITDRSR
jgi:ribosomal protein S18 acetylase RimI-like enzyme